MDPIAEMIVRIKNASAARKDSVLITYSKLKSNILDVLEKNGFVSGIVKKGKKIPKLLEATLVYEDSHPKITDLERVSKPSKRVYRKYTEITPIQQGFGISVLSTPKGILTDREARKEKVGGEVLFNIW